MPLTVQDLVDRAMSIALAGVGDGSPLQDDPMVAEALIPHAIKRLSAKLAAIPDYAHLLRKQQTLTFASGEATLPTNLLPELFDSAELVVPDTFPAGGLSSKLVQWVNSQAAFNGWLEASFYYGLHRNGKVIAKDSTGSAIPDGDLQLNALCDLSDTTLSGLPDTVHDDLVAQLAAMIRDFKEIAG